MQLSEVITFIRENYPNEAIEITECLELLDDALNSALISIKDSSAAAFSQRDFNKIKSLVDMANEIDNIQNELKKYTEALEPEVIENTEQDDEKSVRNLPNYGDYIVDCSVPHTLYEDFKHKRPAAFSFQGTRIEVKTWQDIYLMTCDILFKKDVSKFHAFLSDHSMQGKKSKYFARTEDEMRSPEKLDGADIYIETNMSSNSIRNMIVKMLRKYDVKITEFMVFFRADYTTLHQAN